MNIDRSILVQKSWRNRSRVDDKTLYDAMKCLEEGFAPTAIAKQIGIQDSNLIQIFRGWKLHKNGAKK